MSPLRIRWIGGVAVIGTGPSAAGEPVPSQLGLASLGNGCRGVVLDLAGCNVLSSELLGMMIRTHQAVMAASGRLRVCCPPGRVRESLSATHLDQMMPIFATLAEALADFDPPAK